MRMCQLGGATFNTSSYNVTVAQALLHDPALAAGDNGLTKTGSGVLTLTGSSTYTGQTIISAGTIAMTSGALVNSNSIVCCKHAKQHGCFQFKRRVGHATVFPTAVSGVTAVRPSRVGILPEAHTLTAGDQPGATGLLTLSGW